MDRRAVEVIAAAAQTAYQAAQSHKRAAAFHRRELGKQMANYESLRALCDSHGITLEIDKAQGGAVTDGNLARPVEGL